MPTACRRAGGRIHDPAQAADEVDAGTCHGSLRPFLAHETETLVWRAQPLCLCGCTHATQRPCICHLDAAGARVDAQLGTNRACTSQGRVSSWGFRTTARVILSTHMPCAVECFGIMWLYMHPSRSPGRCGCKHLSDTDGTRVGARTVVMEHVHTICRCSMRVRVRRAHARRAAPCNQIARMPPQRHSWGLRRPWVLYPAWSR